MTTPLLCLLLFALWTLGIVVFGVGAFRVMLVLSGQKAANAFPADTDHGGSPLYKRLNRVHLNCVENLPIFASVVLVGAVLSVESAWLDRLAVAYLVSRIAQSCIHALSTSAMAVNVRFTFFAIQIVCIIAMAWLTVSAAGV